MPAFRCTLIGLGWFLAALLQPLPAIACNVPVFRYALERWTPDAYVMVVFYREPLTPDQQALVEGMEKTADGAMANCLVRKVNVSGKMAPPFQALWKGQTNASTPWLIVRYPAATGFEQPVWAGPLDEAILGALLDCPARRELVSRLQTNSAVWLLLESGDRDADDAVARTLATESKNLEQSLTLPEPDPDDPQLLSELPVKIAFSTVRVSRADSAERMLVNMLLHADKGFSQVTEPMVFGVMGRGRALPPLLGKDLGPQGIRAVGEFVTGPCSCQVKEMNPGYDLLLSANWGSVIGYQEISLPEPPPLVSMSQFAATALSNASTKPTLVMASLVTASTAPAMATNSQLTRNVVIVLGIGVAFLIATTLAMRARGNRSAR